MKGGGKALPIINAIASLPWSTLNRYRRGKPCRIAASRRVMFLFCVGCKKRPLDGLWQPLVMVGETSSHAMRPYTTAKTVEDFDALLLWNIALAAA